MEFGIEKCTLVNIQRGKITRTEGRAVSSFVGALGKMLFGGP